MKGFERKDQLLSLCELNCGLCPMYSEGYCPGCGGGEGNQSCKIAKCSLEHAKIEYCYECKKYPCEKSEHIDELDSFITHRRQKEDFKKVKLIGIEVYHKEQQAKQEILKMLLEKFNDGRKKSFYHVAVNLLELSEIQQILAQIENETELEQLSHKEQCAYVAELFKSVAEQKNIVLKLRKKK